MATTYLKYGSYSHEDYDVQLSVSKNTLFDDSEVGYADEYTFNIKGWLFADTSSELTTKILALEAAYAEDGKDFTFYVNGATSAHVLTNAQTVGGIKVVSGPNYPDGDGAEYTTYRTYEIQLRAEKPRSRSQRADGDVIRFTETLSFSGGGPKFIMQTSINGPPQKQIVCQQTPYKCVQSGSAVGYGDYPPAASPKFFGALHVDQNNISYKSPRKRGTSDFTEFETTWNYNFESATPLSARPTNWIYS